MNQSKNTPNPDNTELGEMENELSNLRNDISNLMTDLMVATNLIKLDKAENMFEQGRKSIHAHNSRLNEVMAKINALISKARIDGEIKGLKYSIQPDGVANIPERVNFRLKELEGKL